MDFVHIYQTRLQTNEKKCCDSAEQGQGIESTLNKYHVIRIANGRLYITAMAFSVSRNRIPASNVYIVILQRFYTIRLELINSAAATGIRFASPGSFHWFLSELHAICR